MNKKSINILLIYLSYDTGETGIEKKELQVGQLYLATVLKKKGYKVKLYSAIFPDLEEIIQLIKEDNYNVIGFYTTSNTIHRVTTMINIIKDSYPSIYIFLGGPHATVLDKETLLETRADLVMRHEAEYTFLEVMEYFYEHKGTLHEIKGITWRKGEEIIRNPDREFIKDLDNLPVPDWHILEGDIAKENLPYPSIITGRGCPFSCTFCFEGFTGNIGRMRSAEHVIKEIDLLLNNWKVKYIKFVDDIFILDSERVEKICSALMERREKKYNFYWFCEARVDILENKTYLLEKMKKAGLAVLQIGVESGNQHILDIYNKKITLEQIEHVVRECVKADLFCIAINVIIGGPFETEETIKKTVDFVKKLIKLAPGRLICYNSLLTPYPGTEIYKNPEKFGLKIIDPSLKDGQTEETCSVESEHMNKYDIYRAKIYLQEEIYKTMIEEIDNITSKQIEDHFCLTEYGIKTPWYKLLSLDKGIKRYFNLLLPSLYRGIEDILPEELGDWCPQRTYPMRYKDKRIILDRINGIVELTEEESIIYKYSSGKLSLNEIIEILTKKLEKSEEELKEKMLNFYKKMNKIYAIIFLRL